MELAGVLGKISPAHREAVSVAGLAHRMQKELGKHLPKGVKTVLAGSCAKGTFLRGAGDIDLFAVFPDSYSKDEMFGALKGAAGKAFPKAKTETGYAEHPYLRMFLEGRRIDLVPSYKMKEGERVKSAVDRSQLHTKYVLSSLDAEQKKEVLLLKQFLKSNMLYGAEIRTKGFSGYLCELMIIHYGSFLGFLEAASLWKLPVSLDPGSLYKKRGPVPDFNSPLTVIDPVDKTRNVAAVITPDNLRRTIFLASSYLKEPSEKYFFPRKLSVPALRKRLGKREIFALCFPKPRIVEDVLWGQLWRVSSQLESFLCKNEFTVLGVRPHSSGSRCIILFELRSPALPKTRVYRGPFLDQTAHVSAFMRRRKGPFYFDHGRIHAMGARKLWNVSLAIGSFRKAPALPSHIRKLLPKAEFLEPHSILKKYPDALREYFGICRFMGK